VKPYEAQKVAKNSSPQQPEASVLLFGPRWIFGVTTFTFVHVVLRLIGVSSSRKFAIPPKFIVDIVEMPVASSAISS
jgi:hypothetical protein